MHLIIAFNTPSHFNDRTMQINTNPELDAAWSIIENTGANLFLTGKAGTGKTTFLKQLKEKSPKRMVVLAPTGIAAINAGGVTIHSFFQLPLSPYLPGVNMGKAENRYFRFSKAKISIIRTMDLLVIDEISMVRADLLDAIDNVMRRFREHNRPFGGVQLLMIGDLHQLSPVIKEDEWSLLGNVYDTPYFFSSKSLNAAKFITLELKQVYRQQDESFLSILNQIRENSVTTDTLAKLNSRYIPNFRPGKNSDYIYLTTHNHPANVINERSLSALPGREYVYDSEIKGVFPESSYPTDTRLVLKEGAQIMFIKNDSEKRFFNGMIGEIVSLSDNEITVRGKDKGREEPFDIDMAEWTNSKYEIDSSSNEIKETVEGVFRQYPLRLAWAITVHKSQGLTFEHAIIDVSHSFAHGQTYVALSRCRTLDGLVLSSPLLPQTIINDGILDDFSCKVAGVPDESQLDILKRNYVVRLLDELFDMISLKASFTLLQRTIEEFFYKKYPKIQSAYKNLGVSFDELITVSRKFRVQYTRLLEEGMSPDDVMFQERVRKASGYFHSKIMPFNELCSKTKVTTENKVAKKQFNERFASYSEQLSLKIGLLRYESLDNVQFSTADYLKRKANILLGESGKVRR